MAGVMTCKLFFVWYGQDWKQYHIKSIKKICPEKWAFGTGIPQSVSLVLSKAENPKHDPLKIIEMIGYILSPKIKTVLDQDLRLIYEEWHKS